MKRIATALCALAVVMAGSIPALAAEVALRQDASYYPISVEEYTYGELEEPRINKVYQLALSDDPSLIPTEDFERDGCWFTLLDMTRKNEVGVDTQPYTETVTRPSKTNDMAQVLQALGLMVTVWLWVSGSMVNPGTLSSSVTMTVPVIPDRTILPVESV